MTGFLIWLHVTYHATLGMESGLMRQLGYRRLRNVQKVFVTQYVDGTAHIAPQGRTLPDLRKIEAKSIDRSSRNVRPFIWPS
jgi:hypothetical protein